MARARFPFSALPASAFNKLLPQDIALLNSQEVIRLAIYVMKRSQIDFTDPITSERVHTEGEKFSPSDRRAGSRTAVLPALTAAAVGREGKDARTTAAQVYLSRDFHIGNSVLHNRSFPLRRPLQSVIAMATFCARASGMELRSAAPGTLIYAASAAGAKWLAKLGQVMFGGPCSHAGHAHHRRTRASLELQESQNMELGNATFHSKSPPSFTGTSATTSSTLHSSRSEKRCKHCSGAISCLVMAALQESSDGVRPEELAAFENSGFGTASAMALNSNVRNPTAPLDFTHSRSSSASSLSMTPPDLQSQHPQPLDNRPHLEHKMDHNVMDFLSRTPPSLHIIFDKSHEHDDEGQETGAGRWPQVPSVSNRRHGLLSEFLADALGANIPSTTSASSSSLSSSVTSLRRSSVVYSSDPSIRRHSLNRSNSQQFVSGSIRRPSLTAPLTRARSSPRPFNSAMVLGDDANDPDQPKSRLERDLAEAAATPSPVLGFVQSFSSVPAVSLGIHPSLESVHEAVVSSGPRRGSNASLASADQSEQGGVGDRQEVKEKQVEVDLVPAQSATSPSRSSSPTSSLSIISPPGVQPQDSRLKDPADSCDGLSSLPTCIPTERRPFYALGIHGQASTESYAREVEESMYRTPSAESGGSRPYPSSATSAFGSGDELVQKEQNEEKKEREKERPVATLRSSSSNTITSPLPESSTDTAQGISGGEIAITASRRPFSHSSTFSSVTASRLASSFGSIHDGVHRLQQQLSGHGDNTGDDVAVDHDLDQVEEEEDVSDTSSFSSSSSLVSDPGSDSYREPLTATELEHKEQQRQEQLQQRRRHKRRMLVDDAQRKQEQLDKIKAQLQLKALGKIREQVSFWEERGVLEQKVVAVVELEEDEEEGKGKEKKEAPGEKERAQTS
ncbi:hypothetical protein EDD11_003785 [Mortierella claussenii]|nr:hypothetical protein EDD11_003785 [Mortierella claussenii]